MSRPLRFRWWGYQAIGWYRVSDPWLASTPLQLLLGGLDAYAGEFPWSSARRLLLDVEAWRGSWLWVANFPSDFQLLAAELDERAAECLQKARRLTKDD